MGHNNTTTFEVRVLVKGDKPIGFRNDDSTHIFDQAVKMFHITARTAQQALNRCKKKGRPLSARKLNAGVMYKDIEALPIQNEIYVNQNPYPNAIAMDEMIWKKRNGNKRK